MSFVEALGRPAATGRDQGGDANALAALSEVSFRALVLEAISRQVEGAAEAAAAAADGQPPPAPAASASPSAGPDSLQATSPSMSGISATEAEVIRREAGRVQIDPALLAALRRVENGGPGREFGVLSVPAPSLEEQARIAANSIQRSAARFARQGGAVVDPATGRYTEGFLRYFSARYAPVGAANDPAGLNRFHAANLIAVYRRVHGDQSSG
jgi:hypothetical protein